MISKNMLGGKSVKEWKEYISYDSSTGKFFLLKKRGNKDVLGEMKMKPHPKWGYNRISLFGKRFYAQRVAWFLFYGEIPDNFIDHINGVRYDNRISNLRECTNSENQANTRAIKSLSGYKGVYPVRNKAGEIVSWAAQWNKKHLGCFRTPDDAAIAYDEALLENRGVFAATNKDIYERRDVGKIP